MRGDQLGMLQLVCDGETFANIVGDAMDTNMAGACTHPSMRTVVCKP